MGNAARQYRPAETTDLRAILSRPFRYPNEGPVCKCKGCRAQRALPFSCVACGYAGEPVTFTCDCKRNWKENVKFLRAVLANPERMKSWVRTPEQVEQDLAEVLAEEPLTICESGNGNCSHTTPECPVCRYFLQSGNTAPEVEHVFGMLRDVRAALTERGLV